MSSSSEVHNTNLKRFAIILLVCEVIIIVIYSIFVRINQEIGTSVNQAFYPFYQDVNVMMLIGFGFLMTFIKSHMWSALSYTFFINALVVQFYILLSQFWTRVFVRGFAQQSTIYLSEPSFTSASYSVASVLIAFGAVLGKVGPFELAIMALVQVVGYTLNEAIVYELLHVNDAGGSMAIHSYGAYFGLTVSLIISRVVKPVRKPPTSYQSNTFAMIGTLFLWMFWPSFNAGFFPTTDYQKSMIIANTILCLTASCLTTFIVSGLLGHKFEIEAIINATLAGGVMIGAPSGVLYNPGISVAIGVVAGGLSTLGFRYVTKALQEWIGLHDTCGIHNLHAVPGLLGGLFSAMIVASYNSTQVFDLNAVSNPLRFPFYSDVLSRTTFLAQGGLQVAGTFISVGLGIVFGAMTGIIISQLYNFEEKQFYRDDLYFEDTELYLDDEKKEMAPEDAQINLTLNRTEVQMVNAKTNNRKDRDDGEYV